MHLISRKTLRQFAARYPDAVGALDHWYVQAKVAQWRSLVDVRRVFPHADAVRVRSDHVATVFNIAGNKYRLITSIHYDVQKAFLMLVLTHKEYSAGRWKELL